MFTTKNVTTVLFWLAFCAFLAMSIPHVAWVYYSYEAHSGFTPIVLSYGVAIGIDVLVCWLSYLQSSKHKGDIVAIWLFIASLAFLSWYCNFLYTMAHSPSQVVDVWTISIYMGVGYVTTGYITPIIISAIPMFVIGYTFMLSRLSTVKRETLEEKAVRLEKEKEAKDRIAKVNEGKMSSRIKSAIGNTVEIARYARDTFTSSNPSQSSQNGTQIASQSSQNGTQIASQPEETVDNISPFPQPLASLQPQNTIVESTLEEVIAIPQPEASEITQPEVISFPQLEEEAITAPLEAVRSNGHNISLESLGKRKR